MVIKDDQDAQSVDFKIGDFIDYQLRLIDGVERAFDHYDLVLT